MKTGEVLVVDDNPQNLKLVYVLLSGEGYDVRTANDAEQTMALLETCHPALIIMDVQLPGIDGLELTRRLRSDSRYCDIVVIALSAYAAASDRDRAMAAGCADYLVKPVDIDALVRVVADCMRA
jgi:CheY-like chemotaxis protein